MNPKAPSTAPGSGPVSKAIAFAESKAAASANGSQVTPDGFLGPTTVLFVTARSDSGPAPKHMIDLMIVLKKAGIRILVASPSNPPFGFEFKKQADKFIMIPNRKFTLKTLFYLKKQIKKHNVNVVHSHGRTAGVYSRLLGKMMGISIVHSPHGVPDGKGFRGALNLFVDKILSDFKYDAVFASKSEHEKALAVGIVKKTTESYIIDNAINLTKYPPRKNAALALSKVDTTKPESYSKIRIGAFLRPESTRGHAAYLKIVKDAAACGQFTCAGITRQQLAKYGTIPPNLEVVGPLTDVTPWLYTLDIFVSTSSSEGQVIGANEAIAAGAICLLSKIPPHEAFHSHQAALLFDAKSPPDFIETVNSLVQDRSMRDMLLGNSRYMLERFNDADSFKVAYLDVYRTCVKRSAGLIL